MCSEDPLAPLHDWSTLGARHSFFGSWGFVLCRRFEKVSNIVFPFKRIVFFLYSVGHVFVGIYGLRSCLCPCGQSLQVHSQGK